MWTSIPEVFPFFKRGRSQSHDRLETAAPPSPGRHGNSRKLGRAVPAVHVNMDKEAYRPGDVVVATIDVGNDVSVKRKAGPPEAGRSISEASLMEDLVVEVKGIERRDPQWIVTPRGTPGAKRKGERAILDSSSTSIVSNVLIGMGETKNYMVRTMLPMVLPPSYKGTAVRYVYYMTVSIRWTYAVAENGHGPSHHVKMAPVEVRTPFQVWVLPNSSGLNADELHSKDHYGFSGIVPPVPIKLKLQWRERDQHSYWAQAADVSDLQLDDDKFSRQSESSTASSPVRDNIDLSFERSLLLSSPRGPAKESLPSTSLRKAWSHSAIPEGLISEKQAAQDAILSRSFDKRIGLWEAASEGSDCIQDPGRSSYGYENGTEMGYAGLREDERGVSPPSSPSVKYQRNKTYNFRIQDQILVQFGPRNPDSIYYYGDTVSGTLSFPREEGARRCLEVSVVLETREILNPSYIHPSRKNSTTVPKVQSEYFETFVASQPNVDWSKYAHPLLIAERETHDWFLPITVHPPLPPRARKEHVGSPRKDELSETHPVSFYSSMGGSPVAPREMASPSSSS